MTKPIWTMCLGVLLVSLLPACELESEELDERFVDLEDECICPGTVPSDIQQPEQATVPTLSNQDPDDDDDDDDNKGVSGAPASDHMSVAPPPIPEECLCAGIELDEDLDNETPED